MRSNWSMNNRQDDPSENEKNRDSSNVKITESESEAGSANTDPGRTPGKAEGVEDPERDGNE